MGKAEKTDKSNKKQKHFWKDFKAELKKVIWPTKSQVVNNTIIVVVIVLIVTAIVFVLDLAFEALNTYGINPLKSMVQNSVTVEDKTEEQNNEDSTNNNEESKEENSEENHDENSGEESGDTANVENVENAQ